MEFWVVYLLVQYSWIVLVWKLVCKLLFAVILVMYLWVELLGDVIILFDFLRKLSSTMAEPFYISIRNIWGFQFQHLLLSFLKKYI